MAALTGRVKSHLGESVSCLCNGYPVQAQDHFSIVAYDVGHYWTTLGSMPQPVRCSAVVFVSWSLTSPSISCTDYWSAFREVCIPHRSVTHATSSRNVLSAGNGLDVHVKNMRLSLASVMQYVKTSVTAPPRDNPNSRLHRIYFGCSCLSIYCIPKLCVLSNQH